MKQKGLFELFFTIIVLVLLLPTNIHKNTSTTPNTLAKADELLLLSDYAIADALADQAFSSCSLNFSDDVINVYLSTLLSEFNKTSGVVCRYDFNNFNYNSSGSCTYDLKVTCASQLKDVNTTITKTSSFIKKVEAIPSSGYCRVIVKGGNPLVTQVDYNLSFP